MHQQVSYHQNCPVCGRNLRIGVTLLGKRVYCQHCGGGFVATEAADGWKTGTAGGTGSPRLDVVDALIERAEIMLARETGGGTE